VPGALDGNIDSTLPRDCYGDVYLTENKVSRVRVGPSKVSFGWDTMQSRSNRTPLDRSDPINSAINGERWGVLFPFFRWQQFRGGSLWERNSPDTFLNEFNLGLEWQFSPQMELTAEYDWVDRTNTGSNARIIDINGAQFQGDLLRFQFQINSRSTAEAAGAHGGHGGDGLARRSVRRSE
jgi:phosphate-selective porin